MPSIPWKAFAASFYARWALGIVPRVNAALAGQQKKRGTSQEKRAATASLDSVVRSFQYQREHLLQLLGTPPLQKAEYNFGDALAYSETHASLWITADAQQDLFGFKGSDSARGFFMKVQAIVGEFQDSLPRKAKRIDLRPMLAIDRKAMRRWTTGSSLPNQGRVTIDSRSVGTTISIVPPPDNPFADLEAPAQLAWWTHLQPKPSLSDLAKNEPETFGAICTSLVDDWQREKRELPAELGPHRIDEFSAVPATWRVKKLHVPSKGADSVKPSLLVVFVADDESSREVILDALGDFDIAVLRVTLEALERELSWRPWVWSKYFGRGVLVARTASDDLDGVLPVNMLGAPTPHPALAGIGVSDGGVLRIRGRQGSGKTTGLRELLCRVPDRVAVVIDASYRSDQRPLVDALLRTLHDDGHQPVLVIDNLDEHAERLPWQHGVPTLVTYRPDTEDDLRARHALAFTTRDAREVDLDAVPDDTMSTFFEMILRAVAPQLRLRPNKYMPKREVRILASLFVRWDALPRTLVTAARASEGGTLHRSMFRPSACGDPRWISAFSALTEDDRAVVTTIALLAGFHVRPLSEVLLYECTQALRKMGRDAFHARLRRVADQGWCGIASDGTIGTREARVHPEVISLWSSASASDSLRTFADWVFHDTHVLAHWRQHILKEIYLLYLREGQLAMAAAFAGYWADHDPDPIALTAAAFAHQWADQEEKARQYAQQIPQVFRAFNGSAEDVHALGDEIAELAHFYGQINYNMPQDMHHQVYDLRLLQGSKPRRPR
jgi:hypothetical protein